MEYSGENIYPVLNGKFSPGFGKDLGSNYRKKGSPVL